MISLHTTSYIRPYRTCRKPHVTGSGSSGRHFYGDDGRWYNADSTAESRYSDFVPCSYDERTLLTRILQSLKYARSFLAQTNGKTLSKTLSNSSNSGSSDSTLCGTDIEMTTSLSPTLQGSAASRSPSSCHGSYRSSRLSCSPRSYIKPPPPAAFPRHAPPSHHPQKRPLSTSTTSSPKIAIDAGTQYSPPINALPTSSSPPTSLWERKSFPNSPRPKDPPAEPALQPQKPVKASTAPSAALQSVKASSSTLPKSSSSSSQSQESSPKRSRTAKPAIKKMPAKYETCDTKDLVVLISNMLLELIRHNDDIPLQDGRLTRFHSRAPPGISVKDYLQRLTTHATLSPPILLSMVYYIDRLCALYPAFTISSLTVHRFLITSATVASKGLSDSFWTNSTYARVGGVSLKELALLELEFLWRVEWRIVPKPEVLEDYYRSLVERSEGFEIEGRPPRSRSTSNSSSDPGPSGREVGEGKPKASSPPER
ncbi:MAG: hypothetical protein Q9217_005603 [Psora testacea]